MICEAERWCFNWQAVLYLLNLPMHNLHLFLKTFKTLLLLKDEVCNNCTKQSYKDNDFFQTGFLPNLPLIGQTDVCGLQKLIPFVTVVANKDTCIHIFKVDHLANGLYFFTHIQLG